MSHDIQVYIADLAAYNNGILHGAWIDATQPIEDMQDEINTLLENSPEEYAEEWAIHDYEGFEGYRLSEYESLQHVFEAATFIEAHGKLGAEVLDYSGGEIEQANKMMEEQYHGCYASVADYAQELTEATSEIPSHLEMYIDYEKMGRDFEYSGDIFSIETAHDEVHVFSSI